MNRAINNVKLRVGPSVRRMDAGAWPCRNDSEAAACGKPSAQGSFFCSPECAVVFAERSTDQDTDNETWIPCKSCKSWIYYGDYPECPSCGHNNETPDND